VAGLAIPSWQYRMTTTHNALKHDDLVEFASQSGSRRASVIIEARRPAMPIGRRRTPPPIVAQMSELQSDLERLGLAARARRNDLAGAFVVEVTPRQLRELATTPSVQAIRLNQFHGRVAA